MVQGDRKQQRSPSSIPPALIGRALIGHTLDERYRIDAELGAGGMGAVYRATHLKLGSPVAIKLLLDQYASSRSLRKRFEREAKALAALRHPNIVAVTDYGLSGDIPYLVMELLEGETLGRRLKRGPFPSAQVKELISQLLRALSFVHAQGLVHRDLKPGNVFFQRLPEGEEQLKLLDFGLAKVVEPDPTVTDPNLTLAGEAVGTPAYMAPEQISGGAADAGSDVYAVGVLLFQLMSGRLPFEGEPMEQLRGHLVEAAPSLSSACPRGPVRPELEALVQRAMAKQPAQRFRDAAEMLAALEAVPQPWTTSDSLPAEQPSGVLAVAPTVVDTARSDAAGAEPGAGAEPAGGTAPEAGAGAAQAPPLAAADAALAVSAPARDSAAQPRSLLFAWLSFGAVVGLSLVAFAAFELHAGGAARHTRALAKPRAQPPAPLQALPAALRAAQGGAAAPAAAPAATAPAAPAAAPESEQPAAATAAADEASAPVAAPAPPAPPVPRARPVPRPPARNPWAHGTPHGLRTLRKVVNAGGFASDRGIGLLRRYIYKYPDDPRGRLLLAHLYMNRHWRTDALREFAAAVEIDMSARGAPEMLPALLALVAHGDVADEAARLVYKAYGKEALPALDRSLRARSPKSEGYKRLHALRTRID